MAVVVMVATIMAITALVPSIATSIPSAGYKRKFLLVQFPFSRQRYFLIL
jgi:hypothetical protein